ncbi:MAG: ABC1 kinase family protein [Isosphaeraceae bacterium]
MDLLGLAQRRDQLKRITEIARTLRRYDLADWIQKIPSGEIRDLLTSHETRALAERPWEERVRLALTELGTTFIKLGQILSTRADLVEPGLAAELSKLQSRTPPDPPEVAGRTIEMELGQRPERLYTEWESNAFASASIAQVHRATLSSGQLVVVKVQHDGIEERIRSDLGLLTALAQLLENHIPRARAYQPVPTVSEFRRTLLHELDFSAEMRNAEEFTRNFAGDGTVHFPVVYPKLCSRRVLTMEMMEGIPGSKQVELHQSGADLEEFAHRAANMYLNMICRDGFYHADQHPGNYMLLPGTIVGVLDCGMVGRIDDELREIFEDLLVALSQRDSEKLCELLLLVCSAPPDIAEAAFRADVTDFLGEYANQSIKEFDLGGALNQMTAIIRGHHLVLPSSVSLILKTLIVLEGTARQLSPNFSLMELVVPFQDHLMRERLKPKYWLAKSRRSRRDVDRLLSNGPKDLIRLLDRLRSGQFEIELEHRHLQTAVNRLVAGLLAAALFLGSAQLYSQSTPPVAFRVSVPGASGCIVALVMGTLLLRNIARGDA